MESGRTYKFVVDAAAVPGYGTFVYHGTVDGDCPEGWWAFDVPDHSGGVGTHPVYVNPANVLTVIPDVR